MGDLTKNFSKHEFACKCNCGFDSISKELVELCEVVRVLNGNKPITISSGCRCPKHNEKIGGEPNSFHTKGVAADIFVDNPKDVYEKLNQKYPNTYGFGLYSNRVHVDIRKEKARWKK